MGNHNSGRGGLDPATKRAIERLLPYTPKAAIARLIGVHRETVIKIDREKRVAESLKNRQGHQ